jgi:hypothetical protein
MNEAEFAEMLRTEVLSDQPRSVGEALEASDATTEAPEELPEAPDEPTPVVPPEPQEPPLRVPDEREQPRDTPEGQPEPAIAAEPGLEPEEGDEGEDTEEDPNVAWATKKYGNEPTKWAKAAFDMERHITTLTAEKREAEELAAQWYQYAQQAEREASQTQQMGMPLSAQEEQWVEQSLVNPLEYARAAALNGNVALYNGVLARVAEENHLLASQIGTQVQVELQQAAAAEQQNGAMQPEMQLPVALAQSFQRLGLDIQTHGPKMSEKIGELGEYHPYVQAILGGDERQRDLAVQAVFDLVRAGTLVSRRVRDENRESQIRREGELRREAAGVVTGSPHTSAPAAQDPFLQAMEDEWKARRQWGGE